MAAPQIGSRNQTLEQYMAHSIGEYGATYISDTNTHYGLWRYIQFLSSTTITTLTEIRNNVNGINVASGVRGVPRVGDTFKNITATNGAVIRVTGILSSGGDWSAGSGSGQIIFEELSSINKYGTSDIASATQSFTDCDANGQIVPGVTTARFVTTAAISGGSTVGGSMVGVTFSAGTVIWGLFTAIKLSSSPALGAVRVGK